MAWRVLLSERPIHRIDFLYGKPPLVAAWTNVTEAGAHARARVAFLDLSSGARVDERTLDLPPSADADPDAWQSFLITLTAPNRDTLPYVRAGQTILFSAPDGALRLLASGTDDLILFRSGAPTRIPLTKPPAALAFDPISGLIAALDRGGRLYLYRGETALGAFDTPLKIQDDLEPIIALPEGASFVVLTDGRQICVLDLNGSVTRSLELHYPLGRLAIAPDGKQLITTDLESHVLRIYTADLILTHQRFAIDLLADSKRAQLLGGAAASESAVGAAALTNKGTLAFALGGALCVTSIGRMKVLPSRGRASTSA